MIISRFADGANVFIQSEVTVQSDTENLYVVNETEQPATSTE